MVKNPPADSGDVGSVPRSGRSPREGNGNPPQYSYLGNPMARGAWWVSKESDTNEWLTVLFRKNWQCHGNWVVS